MSRILLLRYSCRAHRHVPNSVVLARILAATSVIRAALAPSAVRAPLRVRNVPAIPTRPTAQALAPTAQMVQRHHRCADMSSFCILSHTKRATGLFLLHWSMHAWAILEQRTLLPMSRWHIQRRQRGILLSMSRQHLLRC